MINEIRIVKSSLIVRRFTFSEAKISSLNVQENFKSIEKPLKKN